MLHLVIFSASDVNGYLTITRSQFARTDVDLEPPAAGKQFSFCTMRLLALM
jgi:hypothetical protein